MSTPYKSIAVVTVSRSDYGLLSWVLRDLQSSSQFRLQLVVTGAHLRRELGSTIDEILADGFEIAARVEMPALEAGGATLARAIAEGSVGLAEALGRLSPDLVMVLGDRAELLSVATACFALRLPIGHFSGGESTEGAFDQQVRHAMTKMAHVHFAAADPYAQRLLRMGEEPWRVHTVGDPGLDHFVRGTIPGREELERELGFTIAPDAIVLTYHPVTLELDDTGRQIGEVLSALAALPNQVVATYPNGDPGSRLIIEALTDFAAQHAVRVRVVPHLGRRRFLGMLRAVGAMLGNSSAGLVEAASIPLPVVNVGTRQDGRIRGRNVIGVGNSASEIRPSLQHALDPAFRSSLAGMPNPYGDGMTAQRVVKILKGLPDRQTLLWKRFYDVDSIAEVHYA